ncbi:MAG: hypothetical protein JXA42_23150 [Anaerolineales bacterium]|nr:hypothetical protein [Anaerolineales bacterium]
MRKIYIERLTCYIESQRTCLFGWVDGEYTPKVVDPFRAEQRYFWGTLPWEQVQRAIF